MATTTPLPSSSTPPPVAERMVSEVLPADTAQAAAANALAQTLMSPVLVLNTVGAQVNLCTLILAAESHYMRVKRRGRGKRGYVLQPRPVPPRRAGPTVAPAEAAGDELHRNRQRGH